MAKSLRLIASFTAMIFLVSSLTVAKPCSGFSLERSSFSPEDERALGKKFLLMVQSRVPLITDPDVVSYVEKLGKDILAQAGPQLFNYKFYVIRDDALNAFAAPSGLLFIHTGMIESINDESELAGVIAHEIAHVVQRHIAHQVERMQKLSLITLAGVLAGVFLGGGGKAAEAITAGTLATTSAFSLKYSREDEEEADRVGYRWIQAAGYDVRGMTGVFKKIRRYRFLGSPSIPSYLMTHPALDERIGYLEDLILVHPTPVVKRDNSALHQCQIRIALALKSPAEVREKWQAELKETPEDPYLYYGIALSYQAEKQYGKSDGYLDIAAKSGLPKSFVQGEKGINAFGEGNLKEGLSLLKAALKEDSHSARYQANFAKICKEVGELEEAVRHLERIKEDYPYYGEVFYTLSAIYGEQKKTGLAEYNLGMYYYLSGDYRSATKHLKQALNDKNLSRGKTKEIQEVLLELKDASS